jgi:hypothetical protein
MPINRNKIAIPEDLDGEDQYSADDRLAAKRRRRPLIDLISDDLQGRGLPGLVRGSDYRADLAGLCDDAIAAELANDPAGRGYAGKTRPQRAALLNETYLGPVQVPSVDPSGMPTTVTIMERQPPRIAQVLAGIPFAPNAVEPGDL